MLVKDVTRHNNQFGPQRFKIVLFLGQFEYFRGTNRGKILGMGKQNFPASTKVFRKMNSSIR